MRCVAALLICLAPVAPEAGPAGDATRGAQLFRLHCAACHGLDARGLGPLADSMKITPPDLTGLSARGEGAFPVRTIVKRIANRSGGNRPHAEMPVYGWFFEGPAVTLTSDDGTSLETTEAIADLVAWLASVQD
ncbi:c-type cytochrome [Roseobacter sp. S98]|uniref:c-type cytochrome n=1 Tax=Roseobacter algicola (ex Choi et al. 2025) (nom. illeg.) TaxID=3092138 RepID=UPI0035C7686C